MGLIKYKAFYKPLQVMIESAKLESINFDTKVLGIYHPIEIKGFHRFRMSDFELMQYIGSKDKHGNEIHKGDIVKVLIMGGYSDHYTDREHILPVVYNGLNASYEPFDRCRMWRDEELNLSAVEIIGNIYENPELLQPIEAITP